MMSTSEQESRATRPAVTHLVLVRHPESVPPVAGRVVALRDGRADPDLTPAGRDHAGRIISRLAEKTFDAIYTSPLRRTAEPAAALGRRLGVTPVVDDDLREVHLGEWEERMLFPRYLAEKHPIALRVFSEQRWDVIPGAETHAAFETRLRAAVERMTTAHPGGRVAVFTHAGVISELIAIASGATPLAFIQSDSGSLSELGVAGSGWYVRRFNDTAHLA